MSPAAEDEPRVGETDLLGSLSHVSRSGVSDSARTVWVAFGANLLVGVAKSVAAVVTGSASMLAEAAHSWADTGNEVFLLVANRRSYRPPDGTHPLGHGREAYVWSLLAALGLFVAGAAVSVTHGPGADHARAGDGLCRRLLVAWREGTRLDVRGMAALDFGELRSLR